MADSASDRFPPCLEGRRSDSFEPAIEPADSSTTDEPGVAANLAVNRRTTLKGAAAAAAFGIRCDQRAM